jgi:hypothetical protein
MSRHHRRSRLATLAASVGAAVAIASLGSAGSAMALTCTTGGYASGSSLQNKAQDSIWLTAGNWGAHTSCSSFPKIKYEGTSSGAGLNEYGNIDGKLNPAEDPEGEAHGTPNDKAGQALDWYVGTDDPPTTGNLASAIVASGDKNGNLEEITLPVAQAPIAVILSLPAGCEIEEGSSLELDGKDLVEVWEGTVHTWKELLVKLGYAESATSPPGAGEFFSVTAPAGCNEAIILQARETYSGTTYAFKNYLNLDANDLSYNTTTGQFATQNLWTGYISDAPVWPATVKTTGNSKGSSLVKNSAKTPGSIGYANTSDAVASADGGFTDKATSTTFESSAAHQIVYARIQNNVATVTKDEAEHVTPPVDSYADPVSVNGAGTVGNCETDKLLPGDKSPPYSYTDSWYGITAEDPNIALDDTSGNWYPICALTYDLVWRHYNAGGLWASAAAEGVANSVKDLFTYITGAAGQAAIEAEYYSGVPSATLWKNHIALGVSAISG